MGVWYQTRQQKCVNLRSHTRIRWHTQTHACAQTRTHARIHSQSLTRTTHTHSHTHTAHTHTHAHHIIIYNIPPTHHPHACQTHSCNNPLTQCAPIIHLLQGCKLRLAGSAVAGRSHRCNVRHGQCDNDSANSWHETQGVHLRPELPHVCVQLRTICNTWSACTLTIPSSQLPHPFAF